METIKSYTDIGQSKKLAKILPIDSADMYYGYGKDKAEFLPISDVDVKCLSQPCWSLAALLGVLPKIVKLETLFIETSASLWHIGYRGIYIARADNLFDACYELILNLHEQNLL